MIELEAISQENLYYLDESGFDEKQPKPSGYSLKNERLPIKIPGTRTKRHSVIGLRDKDHKLVEPFIYQETANALFIYQYFQLIRGSLIGNIILKPNNTFQSLLFS